MSFRNLSDDLDCMIYAMWFTLSSFSSFTNSEDSYSIWNRSLTFIRYNFFATNCVFFSLFSQGWTNKNCERVLCAEWMNFIHFIYIYECTQNTYIYSIWLFGCILIMSMHLCEYSLVEHALMQSRIITTIDFEYKIDKWNILLYYIYIHCL